jgi:hypothetical protein
VAAPAQQQQVDRQRRDQRDTEENQGAGERHAPVTPC